jgi:peptide/nickel transport system permease protein
VLSPWRLVLRRLRRNRAALTGAAILALLYLAALLAGFLAPYSPYTTSDQAPDHPPHRLHFVDRQGRFHWRPFIYRYQMVDVLRRTYATDLSKGYPVEFFVKGAPYKLFGIIPCERHLFGIPSGEAGDVRIHLLGSDRLGRDILSRVLYGGQISLSVGLIGIVITLSLGMLIGGVSGYFGGWIDTVLMRFVELIMSIPGLYLILTLRASLYGDSPLLRWIFRLEPGEKLTSGQVYLLIIGILGLVGWGSTARVIRGMVLAVRQLDYVRAAQALGASNLRIIVRHVLPNTLTYVIVAATLSVPGYILGEVALSFLGVGIEEPIPSWGLMLRDGQNLRTLVHAPWVLAPGAFIFVTVFAYNFLGDGLRDALDPKAVE